LLTKEKFKKLVSYKLHKKTSKERKETILLPYFLAMNVRLCDVTKLLASLEFNKKK